MQLHSRKTFHMLNLKLRAQAPRALELHEGRPLRSN